jgi:hypothetical protein
VSDGPQHPAILAVLGSRLVRPGPREIVRVSVQGGGAFASQVIHPPRRRRWLGMGDPYA